MTETEFDNTAFSYGMKINIDGEDKNIQGVDFEMGYIGILNEPFDEKITWIHFSECEIVK